MPQGDGIWLKDLLHLLDLLYIGERTARSTINRMRKEGWFEIEKEGRESRLLLTRYGRNILAGGALRQNEVVVETWGGEWQTVVYSLPENLRKQRNNLRKQLSWLGFGALTPGLWISPHDRRPDLRPILSTLQVEPYVHILSSRYLGPLTAQEIVTQCWDIPELAQLYLQFVNRYREEYRALLDSKGRSLSDEAAFQRRFELTVHYFPILQKDPNLPKPLMAADWVGFEARQLYDRYRALLTDLSQTLLAQHIGRS